MKEMLARTTNQGETHMKRTIIIVVLAMALMLALGATPAFAKYAGYNNSLQYVPWATAQSLASANPDAALMARGPHSGYATTTIKCAVCHSVHRGGSKLLNEGSTCAWCHSPAAEGGGAVASNLISWYTPAQGPHSSCASTYCHGGPHGVGASAYDGPASKLLTGALDTKIDALASANGVATSEFDTYSATTRALATGATCGRDGCHDDSMFGVVSAGATQTVDTGGAITEAVTGHRVIATATSNWNANGTDFPTTLTGLAIAYAPVSYCNSCHDLADDNNGGKKAFPHGLSGVVNTAVAADGTWRPAVWLTAGAYVGATRTAVTPYNDYATPNAGGGIIDGVCLKCHRSSATTGVGFDY